MSFGDAEKSLTYRQKPPVQLSVGKLAKMVKIGIKLSRGSVFEMTVSTESDLRELKDLINARFNELDKKFEARFNELDKKFEARFNELDKKFEAGFNELDKKFEAGFNELDKKFEAGFNELDKKLDVYITKTDEKLAAINQNLTQLNERVGKIEDTKEKQVWTLIMVLSGTLLTVALKFVLFGNNP